MPMYFIFCGLPQYMVKYHNRPNRRGYIIPKWSAKKWLVKTQKKHLPNLMVTSISALISTWYDSVFKKIPALSLPLVVLCETLFQPFQSNCELLSGDIQPPYEYWDFKALHYSLNSVRNENIYDDVLLSSHVYPYEEEEEAEKRHFRISLFFFTVVSHNLHIQVTNSRVYDFG